MNGVLVIANIATAPTHKNTRIHTYIPLTYV